MIKRENIKRIQQVLVNLLQEDRENYNQNDLHMLVEEINAISESKMGQTNKQVTIGAGFYGIFSMKLWKLIPIIDRQFETPTRDAKAFSQSKSFNKQQSNVGFGQQSGVGFGGAPQWYNKLKGSLRK